MMSRLFVLLFILSLKLSRSNDLPQYLRSKYGGPVLTSYRRLESIRKKLRKAQLDLDFLLYCRLSNVVPNFVKFRLYRSSLYNTDFYRESTQALLDIEIKHKERIIIKHETTIAELSRTLFNSVSFLDSMYLKTFINRNIISFADRQKQTHNRKLNNLGVNVPNFINPKKTVFNYSSYVLSNREEFLLSLGLDFCMPNYRPNYSQFFLPFELLFQRLSQLPFPTDISKFQRDLHHIAHKTFSSLRNNWAPFLKKEDFH